MWARLRLLSELTREFARSTADYHRLLDLVARRLGETLGESCVIRLVPEHGEYFEAVEGLYHPDPVFLGQWRELVRARPQRFDEGFTGRVLALDQGVLVERTSPEELAAPLERFRGVIERLGITSMIAVPLRAERRPIGVAIMMRSDPANPYTQADLDVLDDLGSHASIAITNSKLLDALERELAERTRATHRLGLLSEVTREFNAATGDYHRLLDLIATRLGHAVGTMCLIRMVAADGEWLESTGTVYHPDPAVAATIHDLLTVPQRVGEGIAGSVVASGKSLLIPALTPEQLAATVGGPHRGLLETLAVRSVIAVALRSEGKAIGAAVMSRSDPDHPFTPDDLQLLEDIASHAAIAIANTRLLDSANRELAQRKRAETELRKTEEQLRQIQKMEAVGRLAGGIAHDFNNLLSVILSYASIMSDALSPRDPMRADLAEIEKASERAAELTAQLLAFSRQQVVEPKILDLNEILASMAKMNRRLIGEDVEYRTVAAHDLGRINADPGHIEQVIMNLIVNARDAMPTGGQLTIETQNVDLDVSYAAGHLGVEAGPYVMLAVSDTGIGMDKATQERIFEPFFTTKDKGKGTGLGLSTVFGIVKQSGGSVWVYSEVGKGTTFKVYFPRTDEIATTTTRISKTPFATLRGSETVLLVDDDDQLRAVAREILQRAGYAVLEACNGGEALLLCEGHAGAIHLLLTDVVMPRMSGRELANRLHALRREMKVLYMSGYTDDAIIHHRVLDSQIVLLQKPLTPESLLRKVREVLQ